jgi:peptide/nickel transport system permease protein
MGRFVARRLLQAVPTLFGILLLTFVLTRLSPSDPVTLIFGDQFNVTAEQRAELRRNLGLDDPLPVQFFNYVGRVVRLDFGNSYYYHRPVLSVIGERLPNSLQLSILALIVGLVIGVPLGVLAALTRGRAPDHVIRFISVGGHAVPTFWFGLLVVLTLGVQLRWLPIGSMNSVGVDCTLCLDRFSRLIGPVLTLALGGISNYPRFVRTEMLEVLSQDYVRTAHSKGLRRSVVVTRHALRNALIPLVTSLGGILTILIGGAVIVEQIYNWPGLGRLFFEALVNKDFPIVQASVVVGSALLLLSYILRDITYAFVDPRIKVGR